MKKAAFLLIYIVGFAICLCSFAVMVAHSGNKSSNLAWLVAGFSEFFRRWEISSNRYGTFSLATMISSASLALMFPLGWLLVTRRSLVLRVVGGIWCAVVVYLSVLWYSTPRNIS